ncbi:TRAP transporter small permease [Ornithinimicrobium sp. Y1847]|uniref:TRAP transporter small permease n=1 Tax=Ornithinimicrobium sp. Y1847 TaxID=3405419 RepID=UPI003B679A26
MKLFGRAVTALGSLLMVGILVLVNLQVFMRYVMDRPLAWADEAARMTYISMVFIVSVALAALMNHIVVTVGSVDLDKPWVRWWNAAGTAVGGFACLLLCYAAWSSMDRLSRGSTAALGLSNGLIMWMAWTTVALTGVLLLVNAVRSLRGTAGVTSELEQAREEAL